ncbi:hypothetical protein BU24DRAFT_217788 [Aaosphaeria arxii CBS 175.79]|uniref:Uncharacterized protein n=1 Tax=Aaosphaeria arxii CBS 175.79 TaxID=1450172 RepID=A0A6A5XP59_9PLEO|nr:uncharacterized protein BU24DRAFT_217788 [Aaosphaeria arxii CBS 175.79]KAF2014627.1 hypothetical protein BU24DRAFT_217788 [Aaosphaeria arxii CBS 175.79]
MLIASLTEPTNLKMDRRRLADGRRIMAERFAGFFPPLLGILGILGRGASRLFLWKVDGTGVCACAVITGGSYFHLEWYECPRCVTRSWSTEYGVPFTTCAVWVVVSGFHHPGVGAPMWWLKASHPPPLLPPLLFIIHYPLFVMLSILSSTSMEFFEVRLRVTMDWGRAKSR